MKKLDQTRFSFRRYRHWARQARRSYESILRHPQWAGGAYAAPLSLWQEYERAQAYASDYRDHLLSETGRDVAS